jgi:hypothetical protein
MKITGAGLISVYSCKNFDDHFLEKVQFSDEATFHVSGAVNRRNVRIWGSENPHAYVEHQRDSPKVNVFCVIYSQKVLKKPLPACHIRNVATVALATFAKHTDVIIQQDGSPAAHFQCEVRQFLNTVLPGCWIGRASGNDQQLSLWLTRSPDITPCDIFS